MAPTPTTGVEAERLRIARELHDIVAHSLATINVQAGAAAHVVAERPDQAAEALQVIREISGEAARELRMVLGLMRAGGEAEPAGRGIERLEALAGTMTRSGLPTRVSVAGPRRPAAPAVDRAAYAIVREALTNALRHAGRASAAVFVAFEEDALVVEVLDDGRGGPSQDGFGIAGMRERAHALGGELEAGPRPRGGFGVRARLPLRGRS